jgi:hypothetical protein
MECIVATKIQELLNAERDCHYSDMIVVPKYNNPTKTIEIKFEKFSSILPPLIVYENWCIYYDPCMTDHRTLHEEVMCQIKRYPRCHMRRLLEHIKPRDSSFQDSAEYICMNSVDELIQVLQEIRDKKY